MIAVQLDPLLVQTGAPRLHGVFFWTFFWLEFIITLPIPGLDKPLVQGLYLR